MKKLLYVTLLAIGVVILMAPPAMAQDEKPFTIHGEVRFRGEFQDNAQDFDDDVDDGALFWPYRVRIAAEGKFAKNVSAWIEFQNVGVAGGGDPFRSGFGGDGSDAELYQGNLTLDQLWSKNFSLRIGRQEIVAGNELLLGDLDFYAGISHDGGVGTWKVRKVNLTVWYTRPLEGSVAFGAGALPPDSVAVTPGVTGATQNFFGGYASWTWKKDQMFDIYAMDLNDRGADSDIVTLGARYARDTTNDGIFWNIEVAQQTGDADTDVDASGRAIEGWFGYNWKAGKNTHRVFARFENATGDDTSTVDDNEGFQSMFGDFHNRTGHGDWFRLAEDPTNLGGASATIDNGGLSAVAVGYNGFYSDRHEFGGQYWSYTLEEDNGSASGDDLGTAIDLWYGFNYSRNVNFVISLSQLSPDDALTATVAGGLDDSVTRLYGQARLRF